VPAQGFDVVEVVAPVGGGVLREYGVARIPEIQEYEGAVFGQAARIVPSGVVSRRPRLRECTAWRSRTGRPQASFAALSELAAPVALKIQVGEALILAVNCSTAWLTAADRMDSYRSKSWWAPGSSA
jgi:hypothetical protein